MKPTTLAFNLNTSRPSYWNIPQSRSIPQLVAAMASHVYHNVEAMQYFRQTSQSYNPAGGCLTHSPQITAVAQTPMITSATSPPPTGVSGALPALSAPASMGPNPTNIHCGAVVLGLPTTPSNAVDSINRVQPQQHGCVCVAAPPQTNANAHTILPPASNAGPTAARIPPLIRSSPTTDPERLGCIKRVE